MMHSIMEWQIHHFQLMSDWVIYCYIVVAMEEFKKARFHTHARVKVSYLSILLKHAM